MPHQPHCPSCTSPLVTPQVRVMPDGVAEYRCPGCSYQIPMLLPTQLDSTRCPICQSSGTPDIIRGVDSSGLLNLVACSSCGAVVGRYWGLI